jgi:hypothetical protein
MFLNIRVMQRPHATKPSDIIVVTLRIADKALWRWPVASEVTMKIVAADRIIINTLFGIYNCFSTYLKKTLSVKWLS